ncbi:anhydro-N-acetylmuramic acid kinase [Actinopolyspora lacussalsi]|uniref:anhydro-N-acetylmuramic acid kinase n=1 Tax=Actinopolyspora righensis TaxID=995060 RepID=UPI001FEA616E|nr:anhydro-N-acetylmuramic acid kinase [Actinopolyspora righensis]
MIYTTRMEPWRVIGLLSGTSMDGVDVAAVEFRLRAGVIESLPLGYSSLPYPETLRRELVSLTRSEDKGPSAWCGLETETGRVFATAARYGVEQLAGGRADLIGSLGQTVRHETVRGRTLGTLQLGGSARIAEATGLPVLADPRSRDVAAGGQGAPLAPVLDVLWLAGLFPPVGNTPPPGRVLALNLGGIANITVVGEGDPLAYDTGPGNALIDAAAELVGSEEGRDTDGTLAARGRVRPDLLERLLSDDYFRLRPPKTTGKEHFGDEYLRNALEALPEVSAPDLLRTVTELTVRTVTEACAAHEAALVIASGGGVANPVLMSGLRRELGRHGAELNTSGQHGIPPDAKEAFLAALLGFLGMHGIAGNIASCTGAEGPRVLGTITPGNRPLSPPDPVGTPVTALRISTPSAFHTSDRESTCASSTWQ